MDGTAILFEPLLRLLPADIRTQVICLNDLNGLEPLEQAKEIAQLVGTDEEITVLCESYSGAIAYHLAHLLVANLRHLIFAASFLENPSKLTHFRQLLPIKLIKAGWIPASILSPICFGQRHNLGLVRLLNTALKSVDNKTLAQRLTLIAKMTRPKNAIELPCTYVSAQSDYLISNKSVRAFQQLFTNIEIIEAKGGHFIVQSNPEVFVDLVERVFAK